MRVVDLGDSVSSRQLTGCWGGGGVCRSMLQAPCDVPPPAGMQSGVLRFSMAYVC